MAPFFLKECCENIFIGDKGSVEKSQISKLNNLGITSVINVAALPDHVEIDKTSFESNGISIIDIAAEDREEYQINKHFSYTNRIINQTLNDGKKILVVCAGGLSRSATIVLAYMLAFKDYDKVLEALNKLRESRQCFNPNDGFKKQLEIYALQQREEKCASRISAEITEIKNLLTLFRDKTCGNQFKDADEKEKLSTELIDLAEKLNDNICKLAQITQDLYRTIIKIVLDSDQNNK